VSKSYLCMLVLNYYFLLLFVDVGTELMYFAIICVCGGGGCMLLLTSFIVIHCC
jgi:hypothetical protein